MTKEPETGTLAELNVKPGDVVRHSGGATYEVRLNDGEPALWSHTEYGDEKSIRGWVVYVSDSIQTYTIVSRASQPDTPKLWRDMTPEEKGALLLAHHEGKSMQYRWPHHKEWNDFEGDSKPIWNSQVAYRIRPEFKRETVKVVIWHEDGDTELGYGTIDLIDGRPISGVYTDDKGNTIRMEEV